MLYASLYPLSPFQSNEICNFPAAGASVYIESLRKNFPKNEIGTREYGEGSYTKAGALALGACGAQRPGCRAAGQAASRRPAPPLPASPFPGPVNAAIRPIANPRGTCYSTTNLMK